MISKNEVIAGLSTIAFAILIAAFALIIIFAPSLALLVGQVIAILLVLSMIGAVLFVFFLEIKYTLDDEDSRKKDK